MRPRRRSGTPAARDRARRRRKGDAQRRRRAADPLHEHLRREQGWTTVHCQDQDPAADGAEHRPSPTATRPARPWRAAGAARSSCAAGGSRSSARASSATAATRPAPTSAAPRSGCSASSTSMPVCVVGSTFGTGRAACSNGGALSSIGVSWVVLSSVLAYNCAIGKGANPARGRHARRRQRRRDLPRRQPVHPHGCRDTLIEQQHGATRAAARCSSSATTAPAP